MYYKHELSKVNASGPQKITFQHMHDYFIIYGCHHNIVDKYSKLLYIYLTSYRSMFLFSFRFHTSRLYLSVVWIFSWTGGVPLPEHLTCVFNLIWRFQSSDFALSLYFGHGLYVCFRLSYPCSRLYVWSRLCLLFIDYINRIFFKLMVVVNCSIKANANRNTSKL